MRTIALFLYYYCFPVYYKILHDLAQKKKKKEKREKSVWRSTAERLAQFKVECSADRRILKTKLCRYILILDALLSFAKYFALSRWTSAEWSMPLTTKLGNLYVKIWYFFRKRFCWTPSGYEFFSIVKYGINNLSLGNLFVHRRLTVFFFLRLRTVWQIQALRRNILFDFTRCNLLFFLTDLLFLHCKIHHPLKL